MAQRLRGDTVEVMLIVNGVPQTTITAIRDFSVIAQMEVLSEGYLGETTERKDSIYKGISGKMSVNPDTQDILKLQAALIDKARRRTPGTKINIKATLNFPNGQRPRVLIQDAEFGEFPFDIGSRKDYAKVDLTFEASEFVVLY